MDKQYLCYSLCACVLQRQHFVCCYWSVCSPALQNHDPSLPYLDQYQLDQSQFSSLFNLLQPWTTHAHLRSLARSAFHLLDENGDGLVNFKEFICGLGKRSLTNPEQPLTFHLCTASFTTWQIHLRESVCVFIADILYNRSFTEKLKLLFKLHLQPGKLIFWCKLIFTVQSLKSSIVI